jgi:hypothetical protein
MCVVVGSDHVQGDKHLALMLTTHDMIVISRVTGRAVHRSGTYARAGLVSFGCVALTWIKC